MRKESWTGKFLDPAKVASRELKICASCWDARNRPVDLHDCEAIMNFSVSDSAYLRLCDCPHRLGQHSDLDTIDHDHDMGLRDLSDPFGPREFSGR